MSADNKYRQVETYLRQALQDGLFQCHDKLPSIRKLSEELQLSKNTVIRAYQELEAQGVIYAVPKSGYRVKEKASRHSPIAKPTEVNLLSVSKALLSYPKEKQQLATGSAHPNIDSPAIKSLYAEIGRHSRLQSQMPSHYQIPPGNDVLIKQLLKISQDLGVPCQTSDIAVTHGAQQGISLALRALTQPGDIVAVESPCYFGNLLLMESLGLQVIEVQGSVTTGIDARSLKDTLQKWPVKAILVTPNFNNPTGSRMSLEGRQALLDVSGDIPIIEDDVFGELFYDSPLPSLKALDTKDRVIYVNSLSKTLDSRLRIGWILSGKYQAQIEKYLICDNMGSLNLMQSAVGEFLTTGKYRSHTRKMTRTYQVNGKRFLSYLTKSLNTHSVLQSRYHLTHPQGSFLCWLTLPNHVDTFDLYQRCLKHRISIYPGMLFGTHNQFKHCIRLNFANFEDNSDWHSGIDKLTKLIAEHLATYDH
ncbi:aminotransferase-like domain-containing protein [Vibrio paucivorans]|uniref:PLP-dependent aminotransferase family protein n=1 Tax=Vibrio paucivorans TaxID=2829489 RepID=A0A9X3CE63_9VIBR|nr:PLP-dependent aminotransferase family protein [Vibrio paucivorans]MCW8334133.1 PLP-dependent aminotransferase family protein [Vibrio paucivorans]